MGGISMDTAEITSQEGVFRTVSTKRKSQTTNQTPIKKVSSEGSVSLNNRFSPLTMAAPLVEGRKPGRVPPIIFDTPMAKVESLLASCAIHIGVGNFTAKILSRSGRVRINPRTKEHHTKLMVELANSHEFHSFTEESDREYSAIVQGLYDMDPETIKTSIRDAGIKDVKAVARRNTKAQIVLYVVRFARGATTLKELQEKCGKLCHCVVTWQQFSPAVKEYTQCRNCQQFGHAGTNCRRKHRCIKCLNDHPKGECPRQTREGTAKCVNCEGDHAANYKGCSKYQEFKAIKVAQQYQNARKPRYQPAPAPPVNFWEKRGELLGAPSSTTFNQAFPPLQRNSLKSTPATERPSPIAVTPVPAQSVAAENPPNPFAELQKLQQELLAINNIWEIIAEYRKIIVAIKSAETPQQAALALISASFK